MKTKEENILDLLLEEISPIEQKKTDVRMLIAAKISDKMKELKWKNKDLLVAVRKNNPSVITKWLSGTHNFSTDTLVEIGEALGIKLVNVEPSRPYVILQCNMAAPVNIPEDMRPILNKQKRTKGTRTIDLNQGEKTRFKNFA